MTIYITGDTHRDIDVHKLSSRAFPLGKTLKRNDYVVVCGDFGCIWHGDNRDDYWLDWYESKPWTTLFVDGNHENHEVLSNMEVGKWHGGKVHYVREHVIHLMRGEVYTVDGLKIFSMGGARSTDREWRTEGVSWWPGEMASASEIEYALTNLEAHNMQIDVVLTHTAPNYLLRSIEKHYGATWKEFDEDPLTNFFEHLRENLTFQQWFFGHFHTDALDLDPKFTALYNNIVSLDEILNLKHC